MQRRLMILALLAALAVSGAALWTLNRSVPVANPSVNIGGPFRLVDHHAKPVTEADFRGRHMLVFFGYTYCPDVCPTAMQTVSEALDMLGKEAGNIRPVFISVDPDRDTPDVLKDFVANFHPSLTGLTGTPEQIKEVANAFRVYFGKVKPEGAEADEYLMNHTAGVYLMGPDGKFLTLFSHNVPPEDMAAKIKKLL
ncbi:MAG: SCO family protein [Rhodospirillales bacterium]|nr:SCO family protein [Alphaproteobacteria bacterium]MBL6948142.1 SCO family protein [Rhodospirillales bacterium]